MLKFLKAIILIAISGWIFHALGEVIDPKRSMKYSLIGVVISTIAIVLIFIKLNQRGQLLVASIGAFLVPLTVGITFASSPLLWSLLLIINLPLCFFIAKRFYIADDEFIFSLDNIFKSEFSGQTQEEFEAGLKGWLYIAICVAVIVAEYKIITYFLAIN